MNYLKIVFEKTDDLITELVIANLEGFDFNGCEEQEDALVAYIIDTAFGAEAEQAIERLVNKYDLSNRIESIVNQN